MSSAPSAIAQLAPPARPSARLWQGLSHPVKREPPARGLDLVGEKARGLASRRRLRAAELHRARAICARADALADLGEQALDAEVDDIRQAVMRWRDDPATIDRAFAIMREVVRRQIGLALHVEQVAGALVMADGRLAEMATGEGKTITAILPAALDGWSGRGVHIVTVNDYLARRDAATCGPAYRRLGLTVAALQDNMPSEQRQRLYQCDVLYGADKQFIFDFLRDRLIAPLAPRLLTAALDEIAGDRAASGDGRPDWTQRITQRGHSSAIIDEADSVLIDEAVTPAIIAEELPSEATEERFSHFRLAADLARELTPGDHYDVDHKLRRITLTPRGRDKLERVSKGLSPFWTGPRRREELMIQALNARELFTAGDDYIVRGAEIVIVDRSTGRILEGRQWQLGLHQAIEAKEALEITGERRTSARISYQRFFQRYQRLCGMTGTAWEVAPELWRWYRLPVVRVPTHKPVVRRQVRDRIFTTEARKFEAVADRVVKLHQQGRPVLVGTRSVIASEKLGALLAERSAPCRILNAVREQEEAEIIAEAGRAGAITVATNMAGRGTDIILDDRARELGGLVVIATERHDEARVDRQLAGRSGRQGDPGLAEVFVSLDDDLIRRYGLAPLAALCRMTHGPLRRLAAAALWRLAQATASRRSAVHRSEVAKADAWVDLAMHHHTR
jgi:preprotein translocase subunit SecA